MSDEYSDQDFKDDGGKDNADIDDIAADKGPRIDVIDNSDTDWDSDWEWEEDKEESPAETVTEGTADGFLKREHNKEYEEEDEEEEFYEEEEEDDKVEEEEDDLDDSPESFVKKQFSKFLKSSHFLFHYGPYEYRGKIAHRKYRITGLAEKVRKTLKVKVLLKPMPTFDRLYIDLNGVRIFSCKLTNMKFDNECEDYTSQLGFLKCREMIANVHGAIIKKIDLEGSNFGMNNNPTI